MTREIKAYVDGQSLRLTQPTVVSDSIDYISAAFVFRSPDWLGTEKWAFFRQGDAVFEVQLIGDRITPDAHLNLSAGLWTVYLIGTKSGTRITTETAELTVEATGILDGKPFPDLPPSFAEQIAQQAAHAEEVAESVRSDADAGLFDGKSAYEIALDNGFEGTEAEWLESLRATGGGGGEWTVTGKPEDKIKVFRSDKKHPLPLVGQSFITIWSQGNTAPDAVAEFLDTETGTVARQYPIIASSGKVAPIFDAPGDSPVQIVMVLGEAAVQAVDAPGAGGGGGGDATKVYVDAQDAKTLESAERYADAKLVTIDIQQRSQNEFWTNPATTAQEIIDMINAGKEVRLHFFDVLTGTGDQLYAYETTDKGVPYFRRNVISETGAERINIGVQYNGEVKFDVTKYKPPQVVAYAVCGDEAEPQSFTPNVWRIPKDSPRPSDEDGMVVDVFWKNGRVGGLGYDAKLVREAEDGTDEVIVENSPVVDALTGERSIPVEGTIRYSLYTIGGKKRWRYVSGATISRQFSTDSAAGEADKIVPGLRLAYIPGQDIFVRFDDGNSAEAARIVPEDGQALPIYGNGVGRKTGSVPPGYIAQLRNAGDYWQILNIQKIPDVPEWALKPQKPTYKADEVGAVVPAGLTAEANVQAILEALNAKPGGGGEKPWELMENVTIAEGTPVANGVTINFSFEEDYYAKSEFIISVWCPVPEANVSLSKILANAFIKGIEPNIMLFFQDEYYPGTKAETYSVHLYTEKAGSEIFLGADLSIETRAEGRALKTKQVPFSQYGAQMSSGKVGGWQGVQILRKIYPGTRYIVLGR